MTYLSHTLIAARVGKLTRLLRKKASNVFPARIAISFSQAKLDSTAIADEEPGTFYLTDFLAQHFDQFVTKPLKLIEHPELRDAYFGNYRRRGLPVANGQRRINAGSEEGGKTTRS